MKFKYAPSKSQKWREYFSHDCAAHKMEIRTGWDSKVPGTCQPWLATYDMEIRTGWESKVGEHVSMIVPLMKWKHALPDNRYVSHDCIAHEMDIRTGWNSKVPRTCQAWLCYTWNGNTHWLRVQSGGNMSAVMVQIMTWNYALPASKHRRLSRAMIASSWRHHSVYPFSHPEICLLGLRMEGIHPWREWSMHRFYTADFAESPNLILTQPRWNPLKNNGSSLIGNRFLDPSKPLL